MFTAQTVEQIPPEGQTHVSGLATRICFWKQVLLAVSALQTSETREGERGEVVGSRLPQRGVGGSHIGDLFHQVRALPQTAINDIFDAFGKFIRHRELIERLNL